ncbi:MAG: DUF4097 family beta strand repeat-containing protein [Streptosporangiaceae bacterium]
MVVLMLVTACGNGQDEVMPVRESARIVIVTDEGVRLRAARTDRVAVEGRVRARWSEGSATLDLSCPEHGGCERMPTVTVPLAASVTVSAHNAGIEASGVTGALELTTVNGDIVVTGVGNDDATLRMITQNGSVRGVSQRAAALDAQTTNGDLILVCDTSPARLNAATTNGSVRVTLPSGGPPYAVATSTDHGQTHVTVPTLGQAPHQLSLRTVNGDLSALAG